MMDFEGRVPNSSNVTHLMPASIVVSEVTGEGGVEIGRNKRMRGQIEEENRQQQ